MAELDSPQNAVRYGEYKKCIKHAWAYRPWLTPTEIEIRANYRPEDNNAWYIAFKVCGYFERNLPPSFLD